MNAMNHDMSACIKACLDCYSTCLSTATHHCLEAGGKHTEPAHFRLMLACAEMCRASAQIMLTGSPAHKHSCAAYCERVGDMERCVAACHACAEECRKMAA
ncbi:hypothetical protein [Aureimonas ureilytica]|uniref:hypothetical protein n=1 Tax=Aureimonas ureilytica TaxID=401562 RepID=UPI00036C4CCA|nr:hypothetical protein [Aureimonas ureilytica]